MYKLIPAIAFSFFILSCGGGSEETSEEQNDFDSTSVDTVFVDSINVVADSTRPKTDVDALIAQGNKWIWSLPLNIDSTFVANRLGDEEEEAYGEYPEYGMSYKDANFLKHNWADNEATRRASWDVTTFIEMDSLIAYNKMDEYQSSIDIGMARYAAGDVIGKVEISNRSFLLLWMTDYSTYEACPYGYGSCLFATLFTDSIALTSTVVWEVSGGGDPPVWGETTVTSTIDNDGITLFYANRFGEEDYETGEEIIEETLDTFLIKMTPEELVPLDDK